MNNKWLIVINPLIAVLIVGQAVTGLNKYWAFLDLKTFNALHVCGGYLLFLLVICHLVINWFWVKNVFIKKKKVPGAGKK
jgi:hypothetical protein